MAVNGKLNMFNYSLNHLVSLLLLLQLIGGKPKAWPAWQGEGWADYRLLLLWNPRCCVVLPSGAKEGLLPTFWSPRVEVMYSQVV